ncbi:hypothetical protein H696_04366 [Fonticula alba]|uniref:Uncharacterized protein n=1 Tax=Fonticula alba TaxID=691883 RepID=A0A058Z611_FONAL|nr:hypothetical protein H696_04366 [Fonticula alba]KCV68947.1 hypothetical protein H696_04366 [Fonticula alba]|eukprot:XP_009496518.1 hypothetical protein H696_04366 [Fonticula alba]
MRLFPPLSLLLVSASAAPTRPPRILPLAPFPSAPDVLPVPSAAVVFVLRGMSSRHMGFLLRVSLQRPGPGRGACLPWFALPTGANCAGCSSAGALARQCALASSSSPCELTPPMGIPFKTTAPAAGGQARPRSGSLGSRVPPPGRKDQGETASPPSPRQGGPPGTREPAGSTDAPPSNVSPVAGSSPPRGAPHCPVSPSRQRR